MTNIVSCSTKSKKSGLKKRGSSKCYTRGKVFKSMFRHAKHGSHYHTTTPKKPHSCHVGKGKHRKSGLKRGVRGRCVSKGKNFRAMFKEAKYM